MKLTLAFLWERWIEVAVVLVYVVATLLQLVVIPAAILAVGCQKACEWAVAKMDAK
jgi:hypothetical protein